MVWLLGLPRSDELVGEALFEAFDAEFVAQQPRHRVPSYGPRERRVGRSSPADDRMLENLKALGYIE
jgi:hypothetical protein